MESYNDVDDVPDLRRSTVPTDFANRLEAAQQSAGSRRMQDRDLLEKGYIAIRPLGRGAFGEVVLAKRTDGSGRVAAIKKIGCRTEDDAVLALEEARTLNNASHEFILQFRNCFVGQDGSAVYLVTEYCSNGSLHDYLHKRGPIPWTLRMNWYQQLLEGLAHLHSIRLVHRDLKPENVMITSSECRFWASEDAGEG